MSELGDVALKIMGEPAKAKDWRFLQRLEDARVLLLVHGILSEGESAKARLRLEKRAAALSSRSVAAQE